MRSKWLLDYKKIISSQHGEDGILEKIFEIIGEKSRWCVEYGAWDGQYLSNTWHLINNKKWSAVLIEADTQKTNELKIKYQDRQDVFCINSFVGEDHPIDSLLATTPIPHDFDFMSADIDGDEYWVWEAMRIYHPRVVIIETNPTFGSDIQFVQKKGQRLGASMRSMVALGKAKGYELVSYIGVNCIFVAKEYYPLFNIADNSCAAMFDSPYQIRLISDYDGNHYLLKPGVWGLKTLSGADKLVEKAQTLEMTSPQASKAGQQQPQTSKPGGQKFSLYHSAGKEDGMLKWLAPYAERFLGCRKVLDIGCGPGYFMELLRERGIGCEGVDYDEAMVAACRERGLNAYVMDARGLTALSEKYDGIHAGHVIEHMPGEDAIRLLANCADLLLPGGKIVLRTPNWANKTVREGGFWLDHTHVRPYPPDLLERVFTDLGLKVVEKGFEPFGWEDTVVVAVKPLVETDQKYPAERSSALCKAKEGELAVIWEGTQFMYHSLSQVNREICSHLLSAGVEISLLPYEMDQFNPEKDAKWKQLVGRIRTNLGRPADIHIRHMWPPDFKPPKEGHWVMMQPWEYGSIPQAWIENMLPQVDDVWVYTNFLRDCYILNGMPAERVHVVPLGVDVKKFHPGVTPMKLPTKKQYKFLFVGGTIHRKGPDILLNAYLNAFTDADDVCLVIKDFGGDTIYRGQTAAQMIAQAKARPHAPEILHLTDNLPLEDMPKLYAACDCLAHPYRGEGFGLPIAEAMASGLPVIVTGAGACLDYCDQSVAYLIPAIRNYLSEKRLGDKTTIALPYLYEPDHLVTARIMRHVFEHKAEAQAVGKRASERIAKYFTWDQAAEAAIERMLTLKTRPIVRLTVAENEKVKALLTTGEQALAVGDFETAVCEFSKIGQEYPELAEAHLALGTALLAAGKAIEAIPSLRRAVELTPGNATLLNQLGIALFNTGAVAEAESIFQQALSADGKDIRALLNLAELCRSREDYAQATGAVRQALEVDANNPDALLAFALISYELQEMQAVEAAVKHLKVVAPDSQQLRDLEAALAG